MFYLIFNLFKIASRGKLTVQLAKKRHKLYSLPEEKENKDKSIQRWIDSTMAEKVNGDDDVDFIAEKDQCNEVKKDCLNACER